MPCDIHDIHVIYTIPCMVYTIFRLYIIIYSMVYHMVYHDNIGHLVLHWLVSVVVRRRGHKADTVLYQQRQRINHRVYTMVDQWPECLRLQYTSSNGRACHDPRPTGQSLGDATLAGSGLSAQQWKTWSGLSAFSSPYCITCIYHGRYHVISRLYVAQTYWWVVWYTSILSWYTMVYHIFLVYTMLYAMLNAVLTYCWVVWYSGFPAMYRIILWFVTDKSWLYNWQVTGYTAVTEQLGNFFHCAIFFTEKLHWLALSSWAVLLIHWVVQLLHSGAIRWQSLALWNKMLPQWQS